jgi:sec-independent protein translocase protein TatA
MGISFWQILIVAAVVVLLFGRGKISSLMGDVAQGIKSFKKGMKDDDEEVTAANREALNAANEGESTDEKRDTAAGG